MQIEEFLKLIEDKIWLPLRQCSLCDEWIGYEIVGMPDRRPLFNSSCMCVLHRTYRQAEWEEVIHYYTQNREYFDKLWEFKNAMD